MKTRRQKWREEKRKSEQNCSAERSAEKREKTDAKEQPERPETAVSEADSDVVMLEFDNSDDEDYCERLKKRLRFDNESEKSSGSVEVEDAMNGIENGTCESNGDVVGEVKEDGKEEKDHVDAMDSVVQQQVIEIHAQASECPDVESDEIDSELDEFPTWNMIYEPSERV